MSSKLWRGLLLLACLGTFGPQVFAQGIGGLSGLGGQSLGGASGMSGGSSASGGSGMFGSSRSLGGGSSAGTRSLTGGGSGANGQPQAGALDSNSRFLRQNRQGGQFVGQNPDGAQSFIGALGAQQQGQQGRNNRNGANSLRPGAGGRQQNQNNQNDDDDEQGSSQTGVRRLYHPHLVVDFDYPTPEPAKLSATLQGVMSRAKRLESRVPYEVSMTGRTAILRGEVGTARDRVVAEKLVLLEPGVSQVQNELTVRAAQAGTAARSDNLKAAAQALPLPPPAALRSQSATQRSAPARPATGRSAPAQPATGQSETVQPRNLRSF